MRGEVEVHVEVHVEVRCVAAHRCVTCTHNTPVNCMLTMVYDERYNTPISFPFSVLICCFQKSKFQLVRYSVTTDVDQALYHWYNEHLNPQQEKSQWYPITYYNVIQVLYSLYSSFSFFLSCYQHHSITSFYQLQYNGTVYFILRERAIADSHSGKSSIASSVSFSFFFFVFFASLFLNLFMNLLYEKVLYLNL